MAEPLWPSRLFIVRHGESAGNVASDAAEAAGHHMIDLAHRDMDVPLSSLGEQQADAGERLAARIAPIGYLAREIADELAGALAAVSDEGGSGGR